MVNTHNKIDGRRIDRHPLGEGKRYRKGTLVIAVEAPIGGVISTPEGEMRYQAGDFILTDDPPTHAWPVQAQIFRNTYRPVIEGIEDEAPAEKTPTEVKRAAIKRKPRKATPKTPRVQIGPRRSFPGKHKGPGEPGRDMAPKEEQIADSKSLEALGG